MEAILDFSKPVDVSLLDQVVAVLMDARNPERQMAERVVMAFKDHEVAWTRVDAILETSQSAQTKYIALQILESVIKYRWKMLPPEQREGIRTYLVQKIIALSQNERTLRTEGVLINKLNLLLVQVLKHEWPANWPSFIPDVVGASKTSEVLCENNVNILKLLSEEIFDFSKESMTAAKAQSLKSSLTTEFAAIFELFDFILKASTKPSLINATLVTLQRYVTWIPERFIFETRLLETLCAKFLPVPAFRVNTLMVLTEVASLAKPEYNRVFEQLYLGVMAQLVRMIPADINVKKAYEAGSADEQVFIRHLALFLVGFFKAHVELLEPEVYRSLLHAGLNYLVGISDIDDPEVFKICLEYWLRLANDLYAQECMYAPTMSMTMMGMPPQAATFPGAGGAGAAARKAIYAEVLSRVREVMINHMAKPEEVLIEEDDSGDIVRETTKDTDAIAMYKVMKDTLVYLTHLDTRDTENIMLDKLAKQVDGREWGWDALNTLCWAIGSISGTMTEVDEKHFLVTVIKDLLGLCEAKRGKNNKAVVASNIMYVVGQYPRFLRAHWKFLRTVVLKLFEFMHEKHPGVQDMAVDTFLKIAQKCRRKFVQVQQGETSTFIEELCGTLPTIIADLEAHQVHTFYEAAGCMVSAHPEAASREFLTEKLMQLPNQIWGRLMKSAAENIDSLRSPDALKDIHRVLRTNVAACRSIGPSFAKQLGRLYLDMLNVYNALSGFISTAVAAGGEAQQSVISSTAIKAMRSVKKEVLSVVSTYVTRSEDPAFVAAHFVPPLFDLVISDYASSVPLAREAEVLTLMAELVAKLRGDILASVPRILESVCDVTLSMITLNFQDFPEHRMAFFRLLESINANCFPALFAIPPSRQKNVVDSVVWALKHTGLDIGETGLGILQAMLENVATAGPDISQPFYSAYYLSLVQDVLYVLTDRLHKAHFKQHAALLRHLFLLVETGAITTPLWESGFASMVGAKASYEGKLAAAAAAAGGVVPPALLTNQQFVRDYVRTIIGSSFKNLTPLQIQGFVDGLFDTTRDLKAYKSHLRDFLVLVLEFKGEDAELFGEEKAEVIAVAAAAERERRKAVPGLLNPYEAPDMDDL